MLPPPPPVTRKEALQPVAGARQRAPVSVPTATERLAPVASADGGAAEAEDDGDTGDTVAEPVRVRVPVAEAETDAVFVAAAVRDGVLVAAALAVPVALGDDPNVAEPVGEIVDAAVVDGDAAGTH